MKLNKYIDHTLLKPESTTDQIRKLCEEARKYDFASVCVNPTHIELCSELLKGSDVKVCTVIGFPLGANTSATKAFVGPTMFLIYASLTSFKNAVSAKSTSSELLYTPLDKKSLLDEADGS